LARQVGAFSHFVHFSIRWRVAIIFGDWVLGALVAFGSLRFIVNLEGGLERVCSSDSSPDVDGTDFVINSL
jgi:hypothetical protein